MNVSSVTAFENVCLICFHNGKCLSIWPTFAALNCFVFFNTEYICREKLTSKIPEIKIYQDVKAC